MNLRSAGKTACQNLHCCYLEVYNFLTLKVWRVVLAEALVTSHLLHNGRLFLAWYKPIAVRIMCCMVTG